MVGDVPAGAPWGGGARLESDRLLRVIGQLDWSVSGEGHPWHVWVTAEPGSALEVARRLTELPGTTLVAVTAGQADVYCSVLPERRADVRDLLSRSSPATPGVRSARSELVLSATAKSDAWRLPRLTEDRIHRLTRHTAQDNPTGTLPTSGTLTDDELRALRLLAADGRTTAAQIARRLDLGGSTAYRLTQSLLQRGLVRPRVEIEPSLLGHALEAVVALTVSPGAITDVAAALAGHASARYVSTSAGHYCVVHQGVFRDEPALADFLSHDLAELPGVTSFDVSIVLEALRRHWLDRESGRLADPR